jgi:hypothetical protein
MGPPKSTKNRPKSTKNRLPTENRAPQIRGFEARDAFRQTANPTVWNCFGALGSPLGALETSREWHFEIVLEIDFG